MKVKMRAEGFEGWAKRARAEHLDRGEKIKPEITINFDSPLEMLQVLTAERVDFVKLPECGPTQ